MSTAWWAVWWLALLGCYPAMIGGQVLWLRWRGYG